MGDLEEQGDVVDEKMWGEDESDDEVNEKEKEEQGKGKSNPNEESDVVAKQVRCRGHGDAVSGRWLSIMVLRGWSTPLEPI